jgi:hypothetical protein
MLEKHKYERVIFPKGKQRAFINEVEKILSITHIARICTCSERTVRDWRREKFHMPISCVVTLKKRAHIAVPKDYKVVPPYSHVRDAGKKGALVTIKKYGRLPVSESYRKKKWMEWWTTNGQFNQSNMLQAQPIRTPRKSAQLAELIGAIMGDGGISRYQVVITLHHKDDREYTQFITQQFKELFNTTPRVHHLPHRSIRNVVVSRIALVRFLYNLGLPIGNKVKQAFDIPLWITINPLFAKACVRGLMDTDGSVFIHSYLSNGKRYAYKKLSFCSHSENLRTSVAKILSDLGMNPHIRGYDVCLDSKSDVQRYFKLIGSHNPKHLKRYLK